MLTERRLAAIMFTDIVGYTALMAESEEKGLRAQERHRELVRPLVEQYHGEAIEARGDESLSVFSTALDAVNCALAIEGQTREEADLRLHIGIHLGDVVLRDGEASGDGVNLASRICALSTDGGVCVSGEVYRSIRNQPRIGAKELGDQDLKNVPEPVAVYALSGEAEAPRLVSAATPTQDPAALRSLAVLPLENLSRDPEQEYFSDGMTEAVISEFARIGALSVVSRTSVMQYKRARKPLPEIAQELGVDAVVEGTVLRAGDRVRITVQLIDAGRDRQLWADRYDRDLSDVLALQSDVARAVAEQVRLQLTPEEQAALTRTRQVDPRAFDAYLRGLKLQGHPTLVFVWGPPAIAYFERAVDVDPDFAEGHAALAQAHFWLGLHGLVVGLRDEFRKAHRAAQWALELDDRLGQAHAVLGKVRLHYDWDFVGARSAFERAVQLSPSDPTALEGYRGYLMQVVEDLVEGRDYAERILRVAPLDPFYRGERFQYFFYSRQYERALEEAERVRELDPSWTPMDLPTTYFLLGRLEEANQVWLEFYDQSGSTGEEPRLARERGWDEGGWEEATLATIEVIRRRRGFSPFAIAGMYTNTTKTDEVFSWLERGYAERDPQMIFLKAYPAFDPLRSDPRFQDLLRRIGFPES